MRPVVVFPFALAAVALAGCRSVPEGTEQAALRVPERDLTLQQLPAAEKAVISPVELPRTPPESKAHRPRRVPRPEPVTVPDGPPREAAPSAEAAAPVAEAAVEEPRIADPPADPRELAPGQTVTVIPASSGPSVAADRTDDTPSAAGRAIMVGRSHGGTCRPRGGVRGIGLAPARPRYR
jgi:hypothetical protein